MSLRDLLSANGHTYESIAQRLATVFPKGLDSVLLERVDAGRQPLPFEVAAPIAEQLGLQVGDIMAEVPFATRITGAAVRRPLPPRSELGETVRQLSYVPTKQVGE